MALPTDEDTFREQFAAEFKYDSDKFFEGIEDYHNGSYIDFNRKIGISAMTAFRAAFGVQVTAVLTAEDATSFGGTDDETSVRVWFGEFGDDESDAAVIDDGDIETAITMLNDDEVNDGRTEAIKSLLDAAGIELDEERIYKRA